MNEEKEHEESIKRQGHFNIDCQTHIFSEEEIEIIQKWGHWFQALSNGTLKPITLLQENFIRVCKGDKEPFSVEEKAWIKYFGRKRWEEKRGDRINIQYQYEEQGFYTLDMKKSMNRMMRGGMSKNHRS